MIVNTCWWNIPLILFHRLALHTWLMSHLISKHRIHLQMAQKCPTQQVKDIIQIVGKCYYSTKQEFEMKPSRTGNRQNSFMSHSSNSKKRNNASIVRYLCSHQSDNVVAACTLHITVSILTFKFPHAAGTNVLILVWCHSNGGTVQSVVRILPLQISHEIRYVHAM